MAEDTLIQKIRKPGRPNGSRVEDFVDFLTSPRSKPHFTTLPRVSLRKAFRAVWDKLRRCRLRRPISSATSFWSRSSPIQTASKKRPAVVVSADAYQSARPDVIVMAVNDQILPAGVSW